VSLGLGEAKTAAAEGHDQFHLMGIVPGLALYGTVAPEATSAWCDLVK
jgi:hypothetical protein